MALTTTDTPLRVVLPYLWIAPAVFLLYKIFTFGRREKHLPPGPPTIPILGNAHLIPSTGFFAQLKEWAEQYGSIYSLKVGKGTIIVLNDRHAIHELFSKRGAWYNDRPVDQQVLNAARNENIALMHESPKWRAERKIAAAYFSAKNLDTNLRAIQEAEFNRMVCDLLEKPKDFRPLIKRTTASIASITIYGHRAPDPESFWGCVRFYYIRHLQLMRVQISKAIEPGSYLPVEQFPILGLIPENWTESKKRGVEFYHTMTNIWNEARDRVEKRRNSGDKRESLLDRLLSEDIKCDAQLTYTELNNFLGGVHMGASDTTATATLNTILFLAKHPEYQEKARAELDRVCGTERTPVWSDFKDLPYINCILKEGLRIRPVLPTGIPHCAKEDRWYEGMLIPAGSTIFAPPFGLNHDSKWLDSPSTYNPDRFLPQADKLAPELAASAKYDERDHYSYGVGRRICVGIHLAERSQWRMAALILWAFKIEREVGENGELIELDTSYACYDEGLLHFPKEFKVRLVPRSEAHAKILRKNMAETEELLKQWE
ncbi:cytochrome p450 [Colletotrichum truncatum]|uniref:Cytochrome p450 n=1 Tax=Colletotrichum truncatum TaxID=5467 RepID=A0ACC3YZI4_COLTU